MGNWGPDDAKCTDKEPVAKAPKEAKQEEPKADAAGAWGPDANAGLKQIAIIFFFCLVGDMLFRRFMAGKEAENAPDAVEKAVEVGNSEGYSIG